MKKFLVFAFSVIALSSVAFAQEGDEATQSAFATVRVPIDVVGVRPMLLGDIYRNDCNAVQQTAEFLIYADNGDLIDVQVNGGEPIILLNTSHTEVTADEENEETLGPPPYVNDPNGLDDQPTIPSMQIIINPTLLYRFVDADEAHAIPWGLPTWTAAYPYCDTQLDDGIERCIPDYLAPGMGQIHVYVGGDYCVLPDQQRGEYEGEITLSSNYVE